VVFPQASVAVHVLTNVKLSSQLPSILFSSNVIAGVASQLSVTVGVIASTTASHSTVSSAGTLLITGAVSSFIVMTCTAEAVLPQLSVAIHVLTIFAEPAQPSAPVSEVSVKEISTSLSQLSVAVIPAALPFPVSSSQLEQKWCFHNHRLRSKFSLR